LAAYSLAALLSLSLFLPSVAKAGGDSIQGGFTVGITISDVSASNIGYYSATISWKTNDDATSQVFYDTEFHEDVADYAYHTDEDATLVAQHSIRLTGLSTSTTYHYRVRSRIPGTDFAAISADHHFATRTPSPGPSPGPGPGPSNYYTKVNMLGGTSKWHISYSGKLLKAVNITSDDGKIAIYIPKNTFCLDEKGKRLKELAIKVEEEIPELSEDYLLLSKAYNFSPGGATFDPYLRLTLAYEEDDISEGVTRGDLYIAYYNTDWVLPDAISDIERNRISTDVTHLTLFAIIEKLPPPPPAEFIVSNLAIGHAKVNPGDEVTITIDVENVGGMEGSYTISLLINNVLEETKRVILAPEALKTVSFAVIKDKPGIYSVDVNSLTRSFEVIEVTAPPAPPVVSWAVLGIIIGAILSVVAVIVSAILVRRRRALKGSGQRQGNSPTTGQFGGKKEG